MRILRAATKTQCSQTLKKKKNVPGPFGEKEGKERSDASLPWKIRKGNLWFKIKAAEQKPCGATVVESSSAALLPLQRKPVELAPRLV